MPNKKVRQKYSGMECPWSNSRPETVRGSNSLTRQNQQQRARAFHVPCPSAIEEFPKGCTIDLIDVLKTIEMFFFFTNLYFIDIFIAR